MSLRAIATELMACEGIALSGAAWPDSRGRLDPCRSRATPTGVCMGTLRV